MKATIKESYSSILIYKRSLALPPNEIMEENMNPTGMCESETESKQDVQSINSSTAIENPSDSTTEEQYLSDDFDEHRLRYLYRYKRDFSYLDFIKWLYAHVPEIVPPDRKICFKEKLIYTACAAAVYLFCSQIPLFGNSSLDPADANYSMRVITASKKGSLMEFGVNHIFIVEVVVIFIINEKNHTPEEKTGIEKAKKLFAICFAVLMAITYVTGGVYGKPAENGVGVSCLIVLQLTLASLIVVLLNEMINSGYGLGPGFVLFIATNVCGTVIWKAVSPTTVKTDQGTEFEGTITALFHFLEITNDKVRALNKVFLRQNLPNLMSLLATILVSGIVVYLQRFRVKLPIKSIRNRGDCSFIHIKLFLISYIPILNMAYILSFLYDVSQALARQNDGNRFVKFLGVWAETKGIEYTYSYPVGGLCYYLSPPENRVSDDPVRAVLYTVFVTGFCVCYSHRWNKLYGKSAKDVAKSLKDHNMVLVEIEEQSMLEELQRYIPTALTIGGLLLGTLSVIADFLGVFGSGHVILIALFFLVEHVEAFYTERITNEQTYTFLG